MSKNKAPGGRTVTSVSSLSFSTPKRMVRVLRHNSPQQAALQPSSATALPCFVAPDSEETAKYKFCRAVPKNKEAPRQKFPKPRQYYSSSQRSSKYSSRPTSSNKALEKLQKQKPKAESKGIKVVTSVLEERPIRENVLARVATVEKQLTSQPKTLEAIVPTVEPTSIENYTEDDSLEDMLRRLNIRREKAQVDESVRRLSNPIHKHKPHCANDIGHKIKTSPSKEAAFPPKKVVAPGLVAISTSIENCTEDESLEDMLRRLNIRREKVDESIRRLSNPIHKHKPHCSNDIGHILKTSPSKDAASPPKRVVAPG